MYTKHTKAHQKIIDWLIWSFEKSVCKQLDTGQAFEYNYCTHTPQDKKKTYLIFWRSSTNA